MSRGSSQYSGHLQEMFPGLARDWTAWLRRRVADEMGVERLPGAPLPLFAKDHKAAKKWPDLDSVADELRSRLKKGLVQLPPNYRYLDDEVVDPSNEYKLERLETYLAYASKFKVVLRHEVMGDGYQKEGAAELSPPVSLYALKDGAADTVDPLPTMLASTDALREHLTLLQVPGIRDIDRQVRKIGNEDWVLKNVVKGALAQQGGLHDSDRRGIKRKLLVALRTVKGLRVLLALGKDFKVSRDLGDQVEALRREAPLLLATELQDLLGNAVPAKQKQFYIATVKAALQ
jgi:hypothetical protein